MAVRFDNVADSLTRTTNLPSGTAYSLLGWFRLTSDRNTYTSFFVYGSSGGVCNSVQTGVDGTNLIIWNGSSESFGSSLVVGTWYHLALTSDGTTTRAYLNGVLNISTASTAVSAQIWVGNSPDNEPLDGRAAAIKIYSATLSADEILREMRTVRPQRTANLNGWYPLLSGGSRTQDYSGAGNNWTAGGTLADEDGPPVSWGGQVLVLPGQAAAGTYTGSGSPSLAALTGAGSGTFTAPANTYTGSGNIALPVLTGSGAGTFVTPTYTGTGAPSLPALAGAGSGTFTPPPTYTGRVHHSLSFAGDNTSDGDRVRIPLTTSGGTVATAANVGAGDFTYEVVVTARYADNSAVPADWRYGNMVMDRDIWNDARGHGLSLGRNGSILTARFGIAGPSGTHTTLESTSNVGDGRPHHIAVDRNASTGLIRLGIDGVWEDSDTYTTGSLAYPTSYTPTGGQDNEVIVLGKEKHDLERGLNGRIAYVRLSTVRRYTGGSYTPPTTLPATDGDTGALYLFLDGTGTTLTDSSAGATHGTLSASPPTWSTDSPFAPAMPPLTGSGTGSFATAIYTGAGVPSLPALTGAGTGTHTAPVYTGTGAADLAALTGAGSGTFVVPTYTGAGAPSLPALTGAGAGTHTAPTYTGSGAPSLPALTGSGIGIFAAEVYSGAGAASLPALTGAGSGAFTAPTYTGSGAPAMAGLVGAGVGTFAAPVYTGTGAASLPALTGSGAGLFASVVYSGAGALSLPALAGTGAGTFTPGSGYTPGGRQERFVALRLRERETRQRVRSREVRP